MKRSKLANPTRTKIILLSVAIAIVLASFVLYLVQTIYPSPKYEDYCGEIEKLGYMNEEINQEICESQNGTWVSQPRQCLTTPCPQGYCDYYSECQKEYDNARNQYRLVVFIVALITGIIAITIGIILSLTSVSLGLMLGGTFLTFYGTAIYWSDLSNWLRTLILGIALGILIWLAYKKLKN